MDEEQKVFYYNSGSSEEGTQTFSVTPQNPEKKKIKGQKYLLVNNYKLVWRVKLIILIWIHHADEILEIYALINTEALAISLVWKNFLPESIKLYKSTYTCEGIGRTTKTQGKKDVKFLLPIISKKRRTYATFYKVERLSTKVPIVLETNLTLPLKISI